MPGFYKFFSGILITICISTMILPGSAFAASQPVSRDHIPDAKQDPKRGINPETGKVSFIGAGDPINVSGVTSFKGLLLQDRAVGILNLYGREFGLKNPGKELKLQKSKKDANGNDIVHYQQVYKGVPILAGAMIVNMNPNGELLSISGEVASDLALDTKPAIHARQARKTALDEIASLYGVDENKFVSSDPELMIFDESLLTASTRPVELVWRMNVSAKDRIQPIREMVLVNAQTGEISFHINLVDTHAKTESFLLQAGGTRQTFTASGGSFLPGTFLCDQSKSSCTNGADVDADEAHRYAADTFAFYSTHHQRNGIDNAGGAILSTVNYGVNYSNAFWTGAQVVYGDDMTADDVVAHEITHGVTEQTSNLIYSGQSGAINESLSDLWGEFVDQTNSSGNDATAVKWLIAEDSALGVIRSMSNPPVYGHPDKMSSPFYYTGTGDNGGVHINSGVNNKAAYLMVQGGTFNGKTIASIGLNKTAAIYYEAQVHHLTSGANYNDLYYALIQACQNLIGGTDGITQNNCDQVRLAAEVVEMVSSSPPSQTPTTTKTSTFIPTATFSSLSKPLYLSLTGSQTLGGVASADEDILRFDGTIWSLFFDGSDVGVGTPDLSAFSIVDADTILMSFNANVTVNGVTATPQDVLRFEATALGNATIGTFNMYFDGSDVGFDDAANEKIDSVKLLPDGRLLISTIGNPSVSGATAARDEDVLAFAPSSLGDTTNGTWTMYFDGSDVGLSETSGEDIDALDVIGNTIYLSTQDIFSVSGVAGEDDDVFICTATSTGDATACNYSFTLYFDGSAWGLTANDIDAFNFLATGPTPTVVPTNTPTRTPIASQTSTRTPTKTSTAGPSPTRTHTPMQSATPTSGSGSTLTFNAIADARVVQTSPTANYGTETTLLVDGDAGAAQTAYIRFTASGINGPIQSARLRVFCATNGTANGPAVHLANSTWTESGTGGVNWNNQPALLSGALDNKGSIAANVWVEYDVTALVNGNGTYTFALVADSSDGVIFSSREGAAPPQLVITPGSAFPASTTSPTNPPSLTNTPVATRTPTAAAATPTFTATKILTSTPTPAASVVPSQTQTTGASQFTFTPIGDAYVDANNPGANYGTLNTLRFDASPIIRSYLRFNVQGLNDSVTRATLRVFANSASSQGCTANTVSDNTWSELALNYNNAPEPGGALGSSGLITAGTWITIDVTAYITGNGTYNLALSTPGSTAVSLASREAGANAPQLVIETAPNIDH